MDCMTASIPDTLRICVGCELELATTGTICDGCRASYQRHRESVSALLAEAEGMRAQLLAALCNVEAALAFSAPKAEPEPTDETTRATREIVMYLDAVGTCFEDLWGLGAVAFAVLVLLAWEVWQRWMHGKG